MMNTNFMKQRLYLICLCTLMLLGSVSAQNKLLNSPSRKLQLAEFAISNLYVDKVDENKLVETAGPSFYLFRSGGSERTERTVTGKF